MGIYQNQQYITITKEYVCIEKGFETGEDIIFYIDKDNPNDFNKNNNKEI